MITAFQILLLAVLALSLLGVVGEKKDKALRDRLVGMFFATLLAFVVLAIVQ